jgi:hypothetical protein
MSREMYLKFSSLGIARESCCEADLGGLFLFMRFTWVLYHQVEARVSTRGSVLSDLP